ncbi:MAG TPA: AAA family ATPase [Crenalkalicoccus sp.]|jgi:class 3 adenylate cyclase/predicted ATPase/ABC-type transport system involved in cytochrome c biogenesis ATPase subunit|nr:AAA family ATPase [Crenalkalicoccus sp.]
MEIMAWLEGLGLGQYARAFAENGVDAQVLPNLTAEDLKEIGVGAVGHRRKLLDAIATLRTVGASASQAVGASGAAPATAPAQAHEAERRQLTVLFADLVGSTALSGRLDPEEMREVIRAYQDVAAGAVVRFGGYVAKFMGDGMLAYFGWPKAHEDAAERAVRSGLSISEAVPRLVTPAGAPLAARVGIASGLVVVGDLLGEGAAQEQAVIGETPNLAARLQETAKPGAVVVADATRRLLGQVFDLRELAAMRLKGFEHPVSGFLVAGERPSESRFEAHHQAGRLPPMVGRDQELALVLERWRQAVAGEGQAVLLVGEAGIGKSRLVRAVLDAAAADEHIALRYQCSPYHTGTALWPVIQQLGFAARLASTDTGAVKLDKLVGLLRQGTEDVGEAAPLLAALLGIELDAACHPMLRDLSPQQRRARTLAVLVEQLLGLARRHPVVMVFEDAHWIDPTTLELLGQTLDRIAGERVLMLLTSRPDNQPTLGGHPHVTRLTLNRLGRDATKAIVSGLAGDQVLPRAALGVIVDRTDGVPLFVEELTKAVLEAGRATGAGAVMPASLHASLMSRLDRVPGVKEVAQAAACIGREFTYPLLAAVSPLPETELQAALDRLVVAELVFRRGVPPEASYTFKHALVRDAAHESLLKAQRQKLHACIVRVLEEHFPGTAIAEPELLAQHCTEAALAERAVDYWQQAGRRALARSATSEAVAHLTRGLEMLAELPGGPAHWRRELGLQLALGQASLAAKGFAAPETGRAYARAGELCRGAGDVPEFFPALYGRFIVHFQRGELAVAHEAARELLRSAESRGDAAARVTGLRIVGSALCHLGRFAESRAHLEAALALYEPGRDRSSALVYALDSRVVCLFWLVHVLLALGYPEQARARMREALGYARELAHPYTLAYALSVACLFHGRHRPGPDARIEADALVTFAAEQGFPLPAAVGRVVGGWARIGEGGAAEEATALMRRGLAEYKATGAELWVPDFLALLAQARGQAGQPAAGLELLAEALDRVAETGGRWLEAELHRLRGELLLASADPGSAAACFRRAMAVARQQDARMWELRASTSLACLLRDQERRVEAHTILASIYGWFDEGFEVPDLVEAKNLVDGLGG